MLYTYPYKDYCLVNRFGVHNTHRITQRSTKRSSTRSTTRTQRIQSKMVKSTMLTGVRRQIETIRTELN